MTIEDEMSCQRGVLGIVTKASGLSLSVGGSRVAFLLAEVTAVRQRMRRLVGEQQSGDHGRLIIGHIVVSGVSTGETVIIFAVARAYALWGKEAEAREILEELSQRISAAVIPRYEGGIYEHQRSPW